MNYSEILSESKRLQASNTDADRKLAINMLEDGMVDHPDVLALGEELVLAYKGGGELDKAISLLEKLEKEFDIIGEETLCRWGSVLKLKANEAVKRNAAGEAISCFRKAERYLRRAFDEFGTHYPRINELTVRFCLAGLLMSNEAQDRARKLLYSVQSDADAMLKDPEIWSAKKLKPQDKAWAPASQGEANILLQRWEAAERSYTAALSALDPEDKRARQAMADQVINVLKPAFVRLELSFNGKLADTVTFFNLPTETQS
jgi:hypothetical protein